MSDPLSITDTLIVPAADLSWSAARSSGPGGQNVNKVASKVELRFDFENSTVLAADVRERLRAIAKAKIDAEGRILVVSQLTRDQSRNLEDARDKLCALIREALVRPKKRRPTKPSRAAKARRMDQKRKQGDKKQSRRGSYD